MADDYRKTVLLDFDGVLHSYKSGWKGARNIPDPPVDGALQFLAEIITFEPVTVCIYSSRSRSFGGKRAMKNWLKDHLIGEILASEINFEKIDSCDWRWLIVNAYDSYDPWEVHVEDAVNAFIKKISFPTKKPAAFITVDDRAICFDGDFSSLLGKINHFKPWYSNGR